MARPQSPYAGTYAPSKMSVTKEELIKGLKGIKIKAPNRKYSTNAYKTGIPKEHQEPA